MTVESLCFDEYNRLPEEVFIILYNLKTIAVHYLILIFLNVKCQVHICDDEYSKYLYHRFFIAIRKQR